MSKETYNPHKTHLEGRKEEIDLDQVARFPHAEKHLIDALVKEHQITPEEALKLLRKHAPSPTMHFENGDE